MGGPTAATMSGNYIKSVDGRELGFSFTFSIDRKFGKTWAFVTGFSLVQKGGMHVELSTEPGQKYGYQSSYLQVPLLLRAAFPVFGGSWYIAPFSGLTVGTNAGLKYKDASRFEFEEEGANENSPGGKPEKLELGIPIGAQFWREFPGGSRFMLGVHYEIGLTNIFQGAADAGQTARNSTLIFQFGFALPLD